MSLYVRSIWCPFSPLNVTVCYYYLVFFFTFYCQCMVLVFGVPFHLLMSLYGISIWCPFSPFNVTLWYSYLVSFFTSECHTMLAGYTLFCNIWKWKKCKLKKVINWKNICLWKKCWSKKVLVKLLLVKKDYCWIKC